MGRLRSSPCCTARSHSRVDSESSRISPQVVYLLLGLLADQKLLLTASDPAVLVPAAQALRALMLPLAHSATCLPFLPPARFAHFCVRNGWLLRLGTSRTSRRLCSRRRTWRRSISEAAFFFFPPAGTRPPRRSCTRSRLPAAPRGPPGMGGTRASSVRRRRLCLEGTACTTWRRWHPSTSPQCTRGMSWRRSRGTRLVGTASS